jgi:hypothetical protein
MDATRRLVRAASEGSRVTSSQETCRPGCPDGPDNRADGARQPSPTGVMLLPVTGTRTLHGSGVPDGAVGVGASAAPFFYGAWVVLRGRRATCVSSDARTAEISTARANRCRGRANNAVGDRLIFPSGLHGSLSVSQKAVPGTIIQCHEIFINTRGVNPGKTFGDLAKTLVLCVSHCGHIWPQWRGRLTWRRPEARLSGGVGSPRNFTASVATELGL